MIISGGKKKVSFLTKSRIEKRKETISIKKIKGNQHRCQEKMRFKNGKKKRYKHCRKVARYLINYHGLKIYVCKAHKRCYNFLKKIG